MMRESLSVETREALEEVDKTIKLILNGKRSFTQLKIFNNGQNPFESPFIDPKAIIKRDLKKQMQLARDIFGEKDFLGPQAVFRAFKLRLNHQSIPPLNLSKEGMQRAKELNQILVLGIDQLADGAPATMLNFYNLCRPKFDELKAGKALCSDPGDGWYSKPKKEEEFFAKEVLKLRWRLVSKEYIKDSLGVNYLEQTQSLVDYLVEKVFADEVMPIEYQTAIAEFESEKAEIAKLIKNDWHSAAKRLSELKINQLCRRSPVEAYYDFLIYFLNNKERLLEHRYDRTFRLDSDGDLVCFGHCGANGPGVDGRGPGGSSDYLGACFSRGL